MVLDLADQVEEVAAVVLQKILMVLEQEEQAVQLTVEEGLERVIHQVRGVLWQDYWPFLRSQLPVLHPTW